MKKTLILTLVLSVLLLVTVMGVSVSAATLQIGEVTVDKDIQNNLVTFTVPYTAVGVKQVTVLAVKGTSSGEPVATDENIVYINQQSSEDGDSFVFSVPYDKFSKDLPYCWIKIGGTSINNARGPADMEVWTPATSALVYGDVNNDANINISDAVTLLKFIQFRNTSGEDATIDTTVFPAGNNTPALANVNGDDQVNISDAVMILTYIGKVQAGGVESLDPVQFPDGKFPAYQKQ